MRRRVPLPDRTTGGSATDAPGDTVAVASPRLETAVHRASSVRPAALLALGGILLLSLSAAAADRPRLRPTPAPVTPVASAAPATSPGPAASPMPAPSGDPLASAAPASTNCFGLERPDTLPAPGSDASASPGPSPAPATPAPTPTDEAATTRIRVPAAGVRLDLPADWIGLDGDDLASLEDIPELTAALADLEATSLVFLGVDVLPGDTCAVGGDLSLYDLGEALDPRLLALSVDAIAAGLESLDAVAGDVKVTTADLPIGEAQRLTFRYDATADGAVTAWWVRADVFTASGRTLLAAYATPESTVDAMKPAFNAIAKSLREL